MGERPAQGAMIGAIVYGVAGAAWSLWGASGLAGAAYAVVAVVGVVAGGTIVVLAVRGLRNARPEAAPMVRSRAYRVTTAAEVVAVVGGILALGALGLGAYTIAWVAVVVGVHFLVFGRVFDPRFHVVGAGLVAAAVLGLVVALAGAGPDGLVAVCGLLSALMLLTTGALVLARRS